MPKPKKDIGKPPAFLNAEEKEVWRQIAREAPPGALTVSDRMAVTYLCRVWARYLKYGEHTGGKSKGATSKQMANVMQLWAKFGMTSMDRSRLHIPHDPSDDEDNPYAEFNTSPRSEWSEFDDPEKPN